jgi:ankyrin repeat protein
MLIAAGADVNLSGGLYGTPLEAASCRGSEQIVQQLLITGANVNDIKVFRDGDISAQGLAQGYISVQATFKSDLDLILAFTEMDLYEGYSMVPLQSASFRGSVEIVELLLAADADVNLIGSRFGTALQASCYRKSARMVHLLLSAVRMSI